MSSPSLATPMDDHKEKDFSAVATAEVEDVDLIDRAIERRALRKIDLNLIPIFALLYMMSFLDRSVLGNANTGGTFAEDLGLVANQFGAAVSLVYSTYVVFEPLWSVLLKILTPRYLLTGTTICWSALTLGTGFVKNFDQLAAVRVLLGLVEAGMIPCSTVYLTTTYMRNEYTTRQTAVFVASATSGAFGGLLAFGLLRVNAAGLHGWQWLYIVLGLISFCLVPLVWFWLPNTVTEARWLNDEEKRVWKLRQARNKHIFDPDEQFSWAAIRNALKDVRMWIHAVGHFGCDCTLYSLTTFMPKICAGLGFTTAIQAQLLTVPVYALAAVSFIIVGRLSDKYKMRGPFHIFGLACCLVGYIFLAAAPKVGVRYAGVFIASIGLYVSTALNVLWVADNFGGHFKRAFSMGFVQLVGNSSGACIGFIFTAQTAPRYLKGLYFDIAMTIMAICCSTLLIFINRRANIAKRAAVEAGAVEQPELGDKNPHYIYYL